MNFTAIIAILELKGIITREEGEKVIEFLNNRPQSTLLSDAVEQVKELVDKELPAIFAKVEEAAKTAAKKEASKVADKAVDEASKVAEKVAGEKAGEAVETAKTEAEKVATEAAAATVDEAAKAVEETTKPQPKAQALKNKA